MSHYLTYRFFNVLITSIFLFAANTVFADSVTVKDAYVRAVPQGQPNSAAFMVIENKSAKDLALVNARSNVSDVVELHTHTKENGMMKMRPVKKIPVKAGSETVLKPGGLHVMFIGIKQELNVGDKVDLQLEFDNGTFIKLSVPVKMVAGMKHMKHMN
ncbi:MAG: copper chaperone PCu(A)C [Gammaproteobacteria bacterium]|nr:copper chaperone PCu(A)C [Gammaproteobacteria bacterium]